MVAASGCPVEGRGVRLQPTAKNSRQTPQLRVFLLTGREFVGHGGGFVNTFNEACGSSMSGYYEQHVNNFLYKMTCFTFLFWIGNALQTISATYFNLEIILLGRFV